MSSVCRREEIASRPCVRTRAREKDQGKNPGLSTERRKKERERKEREGGREKRNQPRDTSPRKTRRATREEERLSGTPKSGMEAWVEWAIGGDERSTAPR